MTPDDLKRRAARNPTAGYHPGGGAGTFFGYGADGKPAYIPGYDSARMLRDARVSFAMKMWRAPFQQVKWKVKAESDAVARFVDATYRRYWRRALPRLLHRYCQYGFAAGGFEWCVRRGKVRLDRVRVVECRDARPLVFRNGPGRGRFAGFRLANTDAGAAVVGLGHAVWYAGQQEFGEFYDRPLLAGMYDAWAEKNVRGGALDTRRLAHFKYAFAGDTIRHPPGATNVGTDENPQIRDNQDLAREAMEQKYAGSGITLTNEMHPADGTKYSWTIEPGETNVNLPSLLEYPKQLDKEILEAAGIPSEVLEASEVGSGWSGRMIPLLSFFGGIDEHVGPLVEAAEPAVRYATRANFGNSYWEVEPIPLTESLKEAAGDGKGGGEGPNPLPQLLGTGGGGKGPGGSALTRPVSMSDDRAAGVTAAARKLMSKRKRDLVGLVVAGMVQEQLRATTAGDPDSAADLVGGLADLAGDPDAVREILSQAVEMSWAAWQGPRGGKGWINDQGRVVYGGTKPGEKREKQKAVAAQARAILSKALHHEASPEDLLQLSDHLPALNVGQLRTARVLLSAKFGGGRRRQEMVDTLVEHVRGRAAEEKRSAAEPKAADPEVSAPPRRGPRSAALADGRVVNFVPHDSAARRGKDFATVMVDPARLDAAWKGDGSYYIPPGGGGGEIAGRAAGFERFLATGAAVQAPRVHLDDAGVVSFEDGRHRTRGLIDRGADRIAVTVRREQADAVRQALGPRPAGTPTTPAKRPDGTPAGTRVEDVHTVPVASLNRDPGRFQYKVSGIKADGVTDELKGVKQYNPELGGTLLVWRDPEDGKDYVVNGHHRHELADRTGAANINARYVDAPSAKVARAKGALANIAEGRGTALDAAKYLRDTGSTPDDLRAAGVSLSGRVVADAVALKDLGDGPFQRLAEGRLDEGQAVAVARHLKDHKLQDALFKKLKQREDDGRDWSGREVEQAARKMAAAGKTVEKGTDLFGDFEDEKSTFDQEVELESHVGRLLQQRAGDYAAVSNVKRADRVADAGNVLKVDENRKRRERAEQEQNVYNQLVNRSGPIAEAIKASAAELAGAKSKKEKESVKQRTWERVQQAIGTELGDKPRPAAASAPEPAPAAGEPVGADAGGAGGGRPGRAEDPAAGGGASGLGGRTPKPATPSHPDRWDHGGLEEQGMAAGRQNWDHWAGDTFGPLAAAGQVTADKWEAESLANAAQSYRERRVNRPISQKLRTGRPLDPGEQRTLDAVNRLAGAGETPTAATLYRTVGDGFPDLKAGDTFRDPAPAFVNFDRATSDNIKVAGRKRTLVIRADKGSPALYIAGGEGPEAVLPSGAQLVVESVDGDTITARYAPARQV